MNDKVVYIHRKATNREVFYVGIGTPERPYRKSPTSRSEFWHKIVNKHGYNIEVIHTGLSWEDACDIEEDLIELIGRRDIGLGTLVNLTNGGDGTLGAVWSDERRARASKYLREVLWTDERKAEAAANYTQEMRDAMSEMHRRPVIDTATGIEYSAMGVACDELGFKLSTITDQLNGRCRIQPYNTLRYQDDINAVGCELFEERRVAFNEILSKNVIDIATNRIYDSMKPACKGVGISYASARLQMCGARKRKEYNTLYKLSELVISPDGYETSKIEDKPIEKVKEKSIELPNKGYTLTANGRMHKEVDEQIASLIAYMRRAS
tara:strand:- start:568 stop:1536 length:969 start_codon:yes stop_codon:yes gene_type:complete